MATLIDGAEWTDNEVYEIQQTDPCEGAGAAASFSGLGVHNEPHQQLANRTAFLKGRQDTNIGNIAALLAFKALFSGAMGPNGYVKIPFLDVNRGLIEIVVQWGFYSFNGLTASQIENMPFTFNFPLPFPNACEWMIPQLASNEGTAPGALGGAALALETIWFEANQAQVFADWNDGGVIRVANSGTGAQGLTGFYWLAIGF